jgi:membrane-bound lytic murein transglycosylase B
MVRNPAFGVAMFTPLMLAAAVAAAGPPTPDSTRAGDVTPAAAVASAPARDMSGPSVVAVTRPPTGFHFATAAASAPPPAVVVSAPGALRIPAIVLSAYRNAETTMARAYPGCGVSWNLLAGIGRIESGHANNGATDVKGTAVSPIFGPALDGTLPGNEIIVASSQLGRVTYARAMGPMQFLPGTWSRYASDGNGDGKTDPQNVYDSSLAAARYLCSGGLNLRDQSQVMSAILRYNNSVAYARNVLGWAAAYTTGIVPVNLPPITGPVPAIADVRFDADAHLEAGPRGLGPGLPTSDPLAQLPLFSLSQTDVANQLPVPPGPADALQGAPLNAPCTIFCITDSPAVAPPWGAPPWAPPAPWAPPVPQAPWAPPGPPAPWAPPGPEATPVIAGPVAGDVPESPAPQPAPAGLLPAPPPPAGPFGAPPPMAPVPPGPAAPAFPVSPWPGPLA